MSESTAAILFKFLKFGLVGFFGLLLDFGVTYLIKEKLNLNKYVANSLGFTVACASNYSLNRAWTFHSADPAIVWQLSKFLLVSVVGLLLNNLILYFLTDRVNINFYYSKFLAIVLVFCWNFSVNYLYTFSNQVMF